MNKIPTVFVRDENDRRHVTQEVTPGCEWVLVGDGTPTRKYDGTCMRLTNDGLWWARREVKSGKDAPPNFVPVQVDEVTHKIVGWEPVEQSAFARWHAEAIEFGNATGITGWPAGTYELVGPKVNGNPERTRQHALWAHGVADVVECPDRTFEGIRAAVLRAAEDGAEGIVFHHPDGRMAKIKARDFLPRAAA
jgi:uncharacterized protein DUF5565